MKEFLGMLKVFLVITLCWWAARALLEQAVFFGILRAVEHLIDNNNGTIIEDFTRIIRV